MYGRRVVVLVHHCHREQWPVAGPALGRLGWFVESTLSPRLHRRNQYLTVSLPSARDLVALGVDNERIAVVRNGLDEAPAQSLSGPRAAAPRVVVLSRLVPHKQIEDALEAVARAAAPHRRVCTSTSSATDGGDSGSSTTFDGSASPTR